MSIKPISELGYEEARDELIAVVQQLEQGGLDLDASLTPLGTWREAGTTMRRALSRSTPKRVEEALAAQRVRRRLTQQLFSLVTLETGTCFSYARPSWVTHL